MIKYSWQTPIEQQRTTSEVIIKQFSSWELFRVMTPTPRKASATKKFLFDHVWGLPCNHTKYNSKDIQVKRNNSFRKNRIENIAQALSLENFIGLKTNLNLGYASKKFLECCLS